MRAFRSRPATSACFDSGICPCAAPAAACEPPCALFASCTSLAAYRTISPARKSCPSAWRSWVPSTLSPICGGRLEGITDNMGIPETCTRSFAQENSADLGQGVALQSVEFAHVQPRPRFRVPDCLSVVAVALIELLLVMT